MRKALLMLATAVLTALVTTACTSDDSNNRGGPNNCSNRGQKEFVLFAMQEWYLWNELLPENVNTRDFDSPEELLAYLITFSPDDGTGNPIDVFSFIDSAAEEDAFFGAGEFEGFGFTYRVVEAGDARLLRVYGGSPADEAGLARGQRILELNGRTVADIQAAEGLNAVFDTSPLSFTMRETDGSEFTVSIDSDTVTIDPIPQWDVIDAGGGRNVGYLELVTFISPADLEFDTVFEAFNAAGVNDVIIDLRYNSGGLVDTANLLGDYLGGDVAENLVFSKTRHNALRAAEFDSEEFFDRLANSMSLSRLVVIATNSTASASELITNSMAPHVEVTIVGDDTRGKPVGQVGFVFCGKVLRPTAFQLLNADDFGDYFGGLPVTPGCEAEDDLSIPIGDAADPNMIAALGYLETGACPARAQAPGAQKAVVPMKQRDPRGPPWREFANAY